MPGLKPTGSDKPLFILLKYFNYKYFLKQYKLYLLYISDINNGAYYRLCNHINNGLSLAVGFKPGILCSMMSAWTETIRSYELNTHM
jgi:hypothetical protein